jgi:hypothetical protein
MVCEQNPGVKLEAELENDAAENLNEHLAILIVANDGPPLVATRGDVVDSPGKLDAKRSCHAPEATSASRERRGEGKRRNGRSRVFNELG